MIPHDQNTQPQFVWRKVQTELKLAKSQRQARIPLKPNIKIESMDIQQDGLQTRLNIDIQRSLQFQDSIGWNWHKSSNLPFLSVKLEIRKSSDNTILIPPAAIHANIYAVKIVQKTLQNEQPSYLLDIGINGQNSIQLSQGCGYFNALRFSSTSYNNEGVRFYLLIVVWKQQNGCQPLSNIISSVISPAIFVDSRKSARNYQEKKFMSFVDLFRPNEIQRFFTKRQARQTKVETESMRTIENNEEGLLHYLTAPNIRHKVKHPLFLAMKFSNAFKIFYNRQSPYFIKNPATLSNVINRIQKKLIKQVGVLRRYKKSENIKKKQFAIVVTSEFQKMSKIRILEMIECLQTNSIQLIQQNTLDQSTFSNIQDLGDIAQVYKQHYVFLIKKTDAQLSSRKSKHCKAQQQEKSLQKAEFPESVIQQKKIIEFSSSQSRAQKRFYDYLGQNNANHDFQAIEALRKKIKLCNAEDFPPKGFQMSNNPFEGYSSFLQMNKHFQRPQKIQNYYKFSLPLRSKGQDPNAKEEGIKIWISEKQVILKIKQMCLQVYQRNKNSILQHLQTLKKSNLKWKVKDVQNFLFYYEGAIMNQIFFRERLLHHMHLENEILKAKLASMQQLALKDLEDIKKNITSMNKYLPESFIKSKLKENAVFNHDIFLPNNRAQGVNTRLLQGNVIIKATQTKQQHQIKHQNSFDVAQKTHEIPMDGQISSSCNFVPNVFNFGESPLNG